MNDVTALLTELGISDRINDNLSKAAQCRQFIPELNRNPDSVFYDYFYSNQIPQTGVFWSELQDRQNWDFKHKLLPLLKKWAMERWPAGAGTVLDLGCGSGLDLCYLGRSFPQKQFIGLDSSIPAKAHVEERARKLGLGNVSVQVSDAFGAARLLHGAGSQGRGPSKGGTSAPLTLEADVLCDAVILNNILDSSFPSALAVARKLRKIRKRLRPSGTIWLSLTPVRASESAMERCVVAASRRAGFAIEERGSFDYSQGSRQVRHLWWSLGCLAESAGRWWQFWR